MPLYEYECQECGERTEVIQRMSDVPPTICADCGGKLKKLISAPAIQFKGSGWYVTDYGRSGSNGSKDSKESRDSKQSDSKDSSKDTSGSKDSAESKSETKKETASTKSTEKSSGPSTSGSN